MQLDTIALQTMTASSHDLGNAFIERVCEWNVANDSSIKKCPRPNSLCTINYLVGNDKVAWLDFLLQTTDSRESDNSTNSDGTQSSNVSSCRDLMRSKLVV